MNNLFCHKDNNKHRKCLEINLTTYTTINLAKRPSGGPINADLFSIVQKEMPTVGDGEFLVKQNHMSLDPAMFGWMSPDTTSYIPPVGLGDVMRSSGIGEIVESNHPEFAVGDRVMGMMGWQEYFLSNGQGLNKVTAPLPDETILSIFALPGLTATQGLFTIGKPQKGETIIVTGAAGSVGSIVGQLAKAEGLKVIGVVGSEEKANWIVNELGFDAAINYKTCGDYQAAINAACPKGVDVYFDNVGGEILDSALLCLNKHARVAVCGWISSYNGEVPHFKNLWQLVAESVTIQGFVVLDYLERFPEGIGQLAELVMAGKLIFKEHIEEGLDNVLPSFLKLFDGSNDGKLIVSIPE